MDQRMIKKRKKMLIAAVAGYVAASMVVLYVRSRLRSKRIPVNYGPIEERDRTRIDYLNKKIWQDDTTCTKTLRLKRALFFQLCEVLRERSLLRDTIHVCIEEQVAMFLNTVGHNLRNSINCIGAIDGTHIRASVSKMMEPTFRGRKSFPTQNVMAAVDFDLRFTSVLAGWEGTTHDAVVLADALKRQNGLHVPQGKYYLVDSGYGAKPGFMPPFRGVRYHLNEWGNNPPEDSRELFNLRHSSLRANKGDAHYLNTPLEHYHEMATIFGNSMATGDYAKGANDPLATDVMDVTSSETSRDTTNTEAIEEGQTSENIRGESSGTKPSKKAKISADDDILSVMTSGLNKIGNAIEKAFAPEPEIPEDLLDHLMALPGFEETHLYHYYAHLCDRPAIACAFNRLGFSGKIIWVTKYICEHNL
ncbi:hypothetical protein ACP4OV_004087 [Aristida adscensionis]